MGRKKLSLATFQNEIRRKKNEKLKMKSESFPFLFICFLVI